MRRYLMVALVVVGTLASLIPTARGGGQGGGFFSIHCELAHRAQDDPIVFPGQPGAAHEHDFFANRSTDAGSKRRTMLDRRSTCGLSLDTAGYWAPTLLDADGNPVAIREVLIYYRSDGAVVEPFPKNLKILAGGDTTNPPAPSRAQHSLSWACGDTAPYTESPPDCSGSGYPVTAHIHFPDCWNGVKTDSTDHRAHMVYGTPDCPAGYVQVPRLRMHIKYETMDADGFMLSSDIQLQQPSGHTLHADFWNTWRQKALRFLVAHCLNSGKSCNDMTDAKLKGMGFDPATA
jgi:hypothetical protein